MSLTGSSGRSPGLTVEVVDTSEGPGVLVALRDVDPCWGMSNLPGRTVRFGERLVDAVRRVAADELGFASALVRCWATSSTPATTRTGCLPVGLVFRAEPLDEAQPQGQWFTALPENMHEEQKGFLLGQALVSPASEGR